MVGGLVTGIRGVMKDIRGKVDVVSALSPWHSRKACPVRV